MSYTNGLDDPSKYMQTALYNGNGTTDTSITGVGFQPDMSWFKGRTNTENHFLFDSIRGATVRLIPNGTSTEATAAQSMKSFDSDGFTLGSDADVNQNTINFVAWNWKAGTSFTNDASATGIGTIDSTGSVNDTSGFSIVTYTAAGAVATIKHGLSSAPKMIFTKKLNGSPNWGVYYGDATDYLELNTTAATQDDVNLWNDTAPTSSVFSVGGDNKSSGGGNYVAYCFAEKQGYSKFGSYTANGSADGGFVYTGFKIGWLMIKRTDSAANWIIYDNKREGRNTENDYILVTSDTEGTNNEIDLYSNGFKPREANRNELNVSGGTYIYMAFAENPFVTSTGVPATAR